MRAIKKILDILSWICYAVIILFLFVAAPFVAGYKPVVVLSPSMEPTYPVGCVAYTKPEAYGNISVGDAITFQSDANVWVTHRVVDKNDSTQSFLTKGDANPTNDPGEVSYGSVIGKAMKYHVPFAGYFVQVIQTPWVLTALAVILIAKIVLGFFGPKEEEKAEGADSESTLEILPEPENAVPVLEKAFSSGEKEPEDGKAPSGQQ